MWRNEFPSYCRSETPENGMGVVSRRYYATKEAFLYAKKHRNGNFFIVNVTWIGHKAVLDIALHCKLKVLGKAL